MHEQIFFTATISLYNQFLRYGLLRNICRKYYNLVCEKLLQFT